MNPEEMSSPVCIYVLIDPQDESVFYVGQTAMPSTRLTNHIGEARSSKSSINKKHMRINAILATGVAPILEIVDNTTRELAFDRERHWILHYMKIGASLTNLVPKNASESQQKKNPISPLPDSIMKAIAVVQEEERLSFADALILLAKETYKAYTGLAMPSIVTRRYEPKHRIFANPDGSIKRGFDFTPDELAKLRERSKDRDKLRQQLNDTND